MPDIAILTDSNSGIMPGEETASNMFVLPMPVLIDGVSYYEGTSITMAQFYQKLSKGAAVTTSQPSPGDVISIWTKLLKDYKEIVHIPMSSGLSNTCSSASMLSMEPEFKGRVHVVDNHRISVTQAQSVLDACHMADLGISAGKIKETLEAEAMDASIYIAVDTLEYLKKGGRITPAAAAFAAVLNLKPVLTIQGDKLDAYKKVRGMKSAFRAMCLAIKQDIDTRFAHLQKQGLLKIGMANTIMPEDELNHWKEQFKEAFPNMEFIHCPLAMSIGCHVGPGGLGVGVFRVHP